MLLWWALGAGTILLAGGAWAQDKEKPRRLPAQERRVAIDKLRQPAADAEQFKNRERLKNLGRNQGPERLQNPEKSGNPQRQDELRGRVGEKARQADANRDGALSREEVGAMPRVSKHFDEIDTNRDGVVSPEEMRAFREKRRQQRMDPGNGDPRF